MAVCLLKIDVKKPLENRGEMEDKGITLSFETDMSLFLVFLFFCFFNRNLIFRIIILLSFSFFFAILQLAR